MAKTPPLNSATLPLPGQRLAPPSVRLARITMSILTYTLLLLLAGFFLLPWAWMISTSLKNPAELMLSPPIWIPQPVRWDNYITAFTQAEFGNYILNTVHITLLSVVGAVLSNALIAYGFARVQWPGRDSVFALVIATLMLPAFVTFIPLYITFRQLGWLNTYLPLIVPTYLGNAFFIFLLRQFLLRIPEELSDAARADGASELRIFTQIIMPLMKPALAVVALFQFIGSWNDYFGPLIYINDKALFTISLGIANMQASYGFSNSAWVMAATCMSTLPIIVLFFFTQRTFIEGITMTGIKG